jgi:3-hydroxybutyryl-CoA dehydrogenase
MRMVGEGVAEAEDIDRAMELGYGHRMGPLKTSDLVGLDVRLAIAETLAADLSDERFAPPDILKRMVADGRTGRKSGEGFYRWEGNQPVPRKRGGA